ncbi:hypothetical protein C8F01DRAFT_1084519 [Mycena amicta]|nr:hypothetical protein C8F01DRAFT_1084519 [Mycena amicta]
MAPLPPPGKQRAGIYEPGIEEPEAPHSTYLLLLLQSRPAPPTLGNTNRRTFYQTTLPGARAPKAGASKSKDRCAVYVTAYCRRRHECAGKGGRKFCTCVGHPALGKNEKSKKVAVRHQLSRLKAARDGWDVNAHPTKHMQLKSEARQTAVHCLLSTNDDMSVKGNQQRQQRRMQRRGRRDGGSQRWRLGSRAMERAAAMDGVTAMDVVTTTGDGMSGASDSVRSCLGDGRDGGSGVEREGESKGHEDLVDSMGPSEASRRE